MHEQEALASIQYQLSQLRHKIVNSLALTDPEHQAVALEREFAVCEKFLKATEDQWQRFDIPNGYR